MSTEPSAPVVFTTGVAQVAALGPNVMLSFAGVTPQKSGAFDMPIVVRVVMSRDDLLNGLKFLTEWTTGALPQASGPTQ